MNSTPNLQPDSLEARKYNRAKRWAEVCDLIVGFGLLITLLLNHGSARLRDLAYDASRQHYSLALFLFVLMLLVVSKVVTIPLDYYAFRLEHRYNLSNQKISGWVWDEVKGWLVGLVLITILVEIFTPPCVLIRTSGGSSYGLYLSGSPFYWRSSRPSCFSRSFTASSPFGTTVYASVSFAERAGRNAGSRRVRVEDLREVEEGQCRADRD